MHLPPLALPARRRLPETRGTRIGYYQLHYADGEEEQVPLVYGQNIDNCVVSKNSRTGAVDLAWTGTNASGTVLCLFHTTWENPRPGTVVESMDFVSQVTKSAPLLIALTVEPDPPRAAENPPNHSK